METAFVFIEAQGLLIPAVLIGERDQRFDLVGRELAAAFLAPLHFQIRTSLTLLCGQTRRMPPPQWHGCTVRTSRPMIDS